MIRRMGCLFMVRNGSNAHSIQVVTTDGKKGTIKCGLFLIGSMFGAIDP